MGIQAIDQTGSRTAATAASYRAHEKLSSNGNSDEFGPLNVRVNLSPTDVALEAHGIGRMSLARASGSRTFGSAKTFVCLSAVPEPLDWFRRYPSPRSRRRTGRSTSSSMQT